MAICEVFLIFISFCDLDESLFIGGAKIAIIDQHESRLQAPIVGFHWRH